MKISLFMGYLVQVKGTQKACENLLNSFTLLISTDDMFVQRWLTKLKWVY